MQIHQQSPRHFGKCWRKGDFLCHVSKCFSFYWFELILREVNSGSNLDKGNIDDPSKGWDKVIQRMYNNGHQIASHTWSHQDLSAISEEARRNEMYRLEAALVTIIGRFPTYMRPPYSSCNGACQATLADLGYHIIYFDLDTDDYNQLGNIQNSKDNVDRAMAGTSPNSKSFLSIAHDIHSQTSLDLAPYMIRRFAEAGYRSEFFPIPLLAVWVGGGIG
jgi:hypothetical protein